MSSRAVSVFFSYSHKDEKLRNELAKHLRTLKRSGIISDWHDRKILPGDEWDHQIKEHLNAAQIILLLISSDFIDSDYCHDVEIDRAMERHQAGEARVIPVILRPCLWEITPLGKLQALPKNGTPVTDLGVWRNLDNAFLNIAQGVHAAAISFSEQPAPTFNIKGAGKGLESKQTVENDAKAQYRERVKEYLIDRELTTFHEIRLGILQKQLKLPDAEAQRIVSEELAPIEQAKETYRDALSRLIEAGHKPSEKETRQGLAQIQQELGITQAEVTAIEQPILAAAEYQFEVMGSERGIDYTRLRDLLKAGAWQDADKETYEVMIRAVGKKSGGYFTKDELLNFPCQDLLTIDRLWVKYSNGRFGFSVQKKIYVDCGATLNGEFPGNTIWRKFSDLVGWRIEGKWVGYSSLTFDTSAPSGHLPGKNVVVWVVWVLFYRIQTCKV
ncbi:MAG: GUN4 domain-containing protein [Cyanobacteria bacterium P01_F01_bin.53]